MQTLQIINSMLASIGQMPVSSADSTHPFAITANNKLDEVNEEVQSRGYWFNKDYSLSLSPNTDGEILLPGTVLSVDAIDTTKQYVQRGNKLYDPYTHSTQFEEDVIVDIIFLIDIEYLPIPAANYIKRKSVYEFFLEKDGEVKKLDALAKLMQEADEKLTAERVRQADTSIENNPTYQYMMGRFHGPEFGGTNKKVWVRK